MSVHADTANRQELSRVAHKSAERDRNGNIQKHLVDQIFFQDKQNEQNAIQGQICQIRTETQNKTDALREDIVNANNQMESVDEIFKKYTEAIQTQKQQISKMLYAAKKTSSHNDFLHESLEEVGSFLSRDLNLQKFESNNVALLKKQYDDHTKNPDFLKEIMCIEATIKHEQQNVIVFAELQKSQEQSMETSRINLAKVKKMHEDEVNFLKALLKTHKTIEDQKQVDRDFYRNTSSKCDELQKVCFDNENEMSKTNEEYQHKKKELEQNRGDFVDFDTMKMEYMNICNTQTETGKQFDAFKDNYNKFIKKSSDTLNALNEHNANVTSDLDSKLQTFAEGYHYKHNNTVSGQNFSDRRQVVQSLPTNKKSSDTLNALNKHNANVTSDLDSHYKHNNAVSGQNFSDRRQVVQSPPTNKKSSDTLNALNKHNANVTSDLDSHYKHNNAVSGQNFSDRRQESETHPMTHQHPIVQNLLTNTSPDSAHIRPEMYSSRKSHTSTGTRVAHPHRPIKYY